MQIDFSEGIFPLYLVRTIKGLTRQLELSQVGQHIEYVPPGGGVQRMTVKSFAQGPGRLSVGIVGAFERARQGMDQRQEAALFEYTLVPEGLKMRITTRTASHFGDKDLMVGGDPNSVVAEGICNDCAESTVPDIDENFASITRVKLPSAPLQKFCLFAIPFHRPVLQCLLRRRLFTTGVPEYSAPPACSSSKTAARRRSGLPAVRSTSPSTTRSALCTVPGAMRCRSALPCPPRTVRMVAVVLFSWPRESPLPTFIAAVAIHATWRVAGNATDQSCSNFASRILRNRPQATVGPACS